jgi:hypothetical protein
MDFDKVKLPAIPMYTADYLNDQKLRLCSMAAQGFWVRMLFVMHHCEPYGHLTFNNGEPATIQDIARVTGVHTNQVTPWVTDLERHGVFSRTRGGVIYSRRMVRDQANRLINQQNGYKGGNPKLKIPVNPQSEIPVNPPLKALSVAVTENSEQLKPLGSNTAVKHQTAQANSDTALLAQESPRREKTAQVEGPPDPLREFKAWVEPMVPGWARGKARKAWREPDDQEALRQIFVVRALHEIQACWELFITPGTKSYDHAVGQRFAMREFQRQMEYLITDEKYPTLKRRYLDRMAAGAPG